MKTLACVLLMTYYTIVQGINLTSNRLSVSVDTNLRSYTISVDGAVWFSSGAAGGYSYSAGSEKFTLSDGTLQAIGSVSHTSSKDPAGEYEALSLSWGPKGGTDVEYITTFKAYKGRSALVFQQSFPKGLNGTEGTVFPSLEQINTETRLGVLEYCGSSCGFMVSAKAGFPAIDGGKSKGYIVITPQDTTGEGVASSLAIGPLTEHFVNQEDMPHHPTILHYTTLYHTRRIHHHPTILYYTTHRSMHIPYIAHSIRDPPRVTGVLTCSLSLSLSVGGCG